ncbi:MAG: hypothetical protein FJ344_06955 [Sphingomonadales bacterium]|nr:hypothetical protein [Sphingomonadales bacterium]
MINARHIGWFGLLLWVSPGCGGDEQQGRQLLVRVGDAALYEDALIDLLPENYNAGDSIAAIDFWIREQLIARAADDELSGRERDFSEELEQYRRTLLRHRLEEKLLEARAQELEPDSASIVRFYRENPELFRLSHPLIKGRYVRVDAKAPRQAQLGGLMRERAGKRLEQLDEYCLQFAWVSHLSDTVWRNPLDFLADVPESTRNSFTYSAINQTQMVQQDSVSHYLMVREWKPVGGTVPMSYALEGIREMVRAERRNRLLQAYYEELKLKAIEDQIVEFVP